MANTNKRRKKKSGGVFDSFRSAFAGAAERAGVSKDEIDRVKRRRKTKGRSRFLKGRD